jgi:glucose-6-phosphate isomerase
LPATPNTPAWIALSKHFQKDIASNSLIKLFEAGGSTRFAELSFQDQNMLLDISKQRLTPKTLALLVQLASERDLSTAIENLFTGGIVNESELRPALHTALRQSSGEYPSVDGKSVQSQIQANLQQMQNIVEKVHAGEWLGFDGQPINTVVNIGVGGSDIGPKMVCQALDEFSAKPRDTLQLLFVSSMDGSQLAEMLQHLDQGRTLFILASKTFTTVDTFANAETVRSWLRKKIPNDKLIGQHHFIGCSANTERMGLWGIPKDHQVRLWDWVGGRYSLWSGIGLPIALKIGMQGFKDLLAGAQSMDHHFRTTDFNQNLPVLLAMTGIWNINILGLKAHAILPYDGRLKLLPHYLSQLEMESNGKSVTTKGDRVSMDTSPVIWGDIGADAQHAFFQLLHQGTAAFYADFITPIARQPSNQYSKATQQQLKYQQNLNLANCLAQSRALMMGDSVLDWDESSDQPADHLYIGNHPSTSLMLEDLTPYGLGSLLAMYEHKVYVQAVIWDINPFDQWGVELGKKIAKTTLNAISQRQNGQPVDEEFDKSTEGLLSYINQYWVGH